MLDQTQCVPALIHYFRLWSAASSEGRRTSLQHLNSNTLCATNLPISVWSLIILSIIKNTSSSKGSEFLENPTLV